MKYLDRQNIKYIGISSDKKNVEHAVFDINGTKIAYIGFADFHNKSAMFASEENIRKYIAEANKEADIVVASFHFGEEYRSKPNDRQEYLAHMAIDMGADIVIGHHPHVTQPVVKYKNGYIAFSLGNFIFDQDFSKDTMEGMLLEVEVFDKKISKVTPRVVELNKHFQPQIR